MSPVVIVGAPGAGKTTIGKLVAEALDVPLVDVDQRIEKFAGKPIREIFVDDGEPFFRRLEVEHTLSALGGSGIVTLGGGAVTSAEIRAALADHVVVWLKVSAPQAARRVGINASRPLLWGSVRERLEQLLAERTPWYEEVATITVSTDHTDPGDVTDAVLTALGRLHEL